METVQDPAQEPASPPAKPARSAAGILAAFILIVFVLYVGRLFFITLVTAVLLAFILEPLVGFFMRFKVPRGGASFLACTVMLISLYLAGLGAWSQAVGFLEALPTYTQRLTDLVDSATVRLDEVERAARDLLIPQRVRDPKPPRRKRGRRPRPPAKPPPNAAAPSLNPRSTSPRSPKSRKSASAPNAPSSSMPSLPTSAASMTSS